MRSLPLVLALAAMPTAAVACSEPAGYERVEFAQELATATRVVIIRAESQSLIEEAKNSPPSRGIVADVRVVESLFGPSGASLRQITYYSTWCGGHRLDVGGYYVAVLKNDLAELELSHSSQLVIGLGDEYSEPIGDNGASTLLMYMRNFAKGAPFPAAFNVEPYLALARMPVQAPTSEAAGR